MASSNATWLPPLSESLPNTAMTNTSRAISTSRGMAETIGRGLWSLIVR